MKNNISINDFDYLELGAAFLGSGGGGDANYMRMHAEYMSGLFGNINLISKEDLNDGDLILPIAFMGSPLVLKEKFFSVESMIKIVEIIEKINNKKIKAFSGVEIGGGNAFSPLIIASKLNIPLLDADMIGRAFPCLYMASTNVNKIKPKDAIFVDNKGNSIILNVDNFYELENYGRAIAIAAGSCIVCCIQVLTGKEAKKGLIFGSYLNAINIGKTLKKINNISDLKNNLDINIIGAGIVKKIDQKICSGFSQGYIYIESENKDIYKILIKNEYLAVYKNEKLIIQTPDIITLLEDETFVPILSDKIKWGNKVNIVSMRPTDIWHTKDGLSLVSLDALSKNNI
jgi:DUF917 family protein